MYAVYKTVAVVSSAVKVAAVDRSVVAVVAVLLVELVVVVSYLIYSVRFVVFCFIIITC